MTELLLKDNQHPQFSGHETFPLRQLWLRKAYDAVTETAEPAQRSVFSGEDAIVRFGVGKNMAMAIRFWATACGIVEENNGYIASELGHFLFDPERGVDLYCESPATTWLVHWILASSPEKTTTWWYLFNHVVQQVFDREHLVKALSVFKDEYKLRISLAEDVKLVVAQE